jgi:pimeloyl-ACP methyl ester carboxylesterase
VPPLPLRLGSRMVAFAAEWMTTPIHHLVYNPKNVERGIAGPAMMTIEDIPGPLNVDFLSFIRRGIVHYEGNDALDGLRHVSTPVLFFAGARDHLAPPEAVRIAYDAWGTEAGEDVDKRFVLLAESAGASADYGHGDLAIGRDAKKDIFEPIERFLAA